MDSITMSAQPQDIGPVVAIVGTKGWQCRLCSTTFPRSFSIDHHMISNHHPQTQQEPVLPSAASTRGRGDGGMSWRQDEVMQDMSSGDGSHRASLNENSKTGSSSSESRKEARSDPICSETAINCQHTTESGRTDGSVHVKVEPGVNNCNTPADVRYQQSLPVYFDEKQQSASPLNPIPTENMSVAGYSNIDSRNTPAGMNQNVEADLNSTEGRPAHPSAQDGHTLGNSSQTRRPGKQKVSDSVKPYKRRTCSCGQEFESKHEFRHHRRVAHCRLRHKTFVCHICNAEYQYKRGLNRHIADKGSVPYSCSDCPKRFHDQISLKEHRELGHNSEPCASVSSVNNGKDDGKDKTQSSCNDSEKPSHEGVEDIFPWECSKCKKHFEDKCYFRKHLIACGVLTFKDDKRYFTCNLCGISFHWMVQYHKHYVHEHKLAFLGDSANTSNNPAHFSPFTGNSPAPSPAPSVTSEINTAMAGVSLNHSRILDVGEDSSPCSSTMDLTSNVELDEEVDVKPHVMTTVCSSAHLVTTVAGSSDHPVIPVTESATPESLSLISGTSSSEPLSLTSTASSSNPRSLTSEFSSSCPWSLASAASSSGQTSEVESIIISDTEETDSSDPSSDSENEWEMVQDGEGEEKSVKEQKARQQAADHKVAHTEARPHASSQSGHPFPPPPPPHPHPGHPFPGGPPFWGEHFVPPHGHRFPPHFHHFPHHPRFTHGGSFRGMRGFFGAARFGHPDWFTQGGGTDNGPQRPECATSTSSSEAGGSSSRSSALPDQGPKSSQSDDAAGTSFGQEFESSTPFAHAAGFCKWAGKWKEKRIPKFKVEKMIWKLLKSGPVDGQVLVCPEDDCPQTFTEESELDKHCRENHPSSKEYVCCFCQQPYSQPVSYIRHVREHCEAVYQRMGHRGRGRGRGDRLMGLGGRILKQLWKSASPYGVWGSQLFGYGHQPQDADKDSNSPEGSAPKDFKECPVCKKKYRANSRESFFERHVNSHYGIEVYSFKCEECGKKFLEKGKFTAHQAKHKSAPYVCQVCGSSYQSKTSLKRHERKHTGECPHKCPDCGEGFIELRQLERHRMKHTGQDPFQCKVCGRGFTLKDSLRNHIRRQHPEENPDLCIKRAMPLSETDRKLHKATLPSQPQASEPVEDQRRHEQEEPIVMEMD